MQKAPGIKSEENELCLVMILTVFPHRTAVVQPEEMMLSKWRGERETGKNSSSSRGGEEESRGREGGTDEENNSRGAGAGGGQQEGDRQEEQDSQERGERTETDSESEAQFREALRKEKQRKRKRSGNGGGGDGDDIETVSGNIPVDLLRRMSALCEKLGISMRQQLSLTMGFVELCGELKWNIKFQCKVFLHRS